jgi:pimeloyl-ACP methyl ester carboxylesterase
MTVTSAAVPRHPESIRHIPTIDGFRVPVRLAGPDTGRVVVMFDGSPDRAAPYDVVRERLHVAMFRTVTFPVLDGLRPKVIIDILDRLKVAGGLLVGDGVGGELAWRLAATHRERFTGLVVIDCGHPRVPTETGFVRDKRCPAVAADTTALVSTHSAHAAARASKRYVHGEFRLLELAGPRSSRHFAAQLTTEIVVRVLSR